MEGGNEGSVDEREVVIEALEVAEVERFLKKGILERRREGSWGGVEEGW